MHTWEARIERGEYKVRQAILSNREAAGPCPVNVSAGSRAVALLRDRGPVMGTPGGGVFVAEAPAGSRP
jgi:DNA-binding transcriptional regulator YhcF (GntR family)